MFKLNVLGRNIQNNTGKEIYNEIRNFGLSEIAWILIDKYQILGKT